MQRFTPAAAFVAPVVLGAAIFGVLDLPAFGAATPSPKPSRSVEVPTFVGPPGWRHIKGSSDALGIWLHSGDTGYSQNIIVESKDGYQSLDTLLQAEVNYIRGLPDVVGSAPTDTTVCGHHPAKYISYTYSTDTGLPVTTEVVIAVFGKTAYSAKYNKSISENADVAAERSLSTLCGHPAAH